MGIFVVACLAARAAGDDSATIHVNIEWDQLRSEGGQPLVALPGIANLEREAPAFDPSELWRALRNTSTFPAKVAAVLGASTPTRATFPAC